MALIPLLAEMLGGASVGAGPADMAGQIAGETIPALVSGELALLVTLLKVAVIVALMLVAGRRLIPWGPHCTANLR